jgi:tetratricopeptide (TPR) repeat protein
LRGAEQQQWLDRLDGEHDNLRAALGWLVQRGEGEAGAAAGGRAVALLGRPEPPDGGADLAGAGAGRACGRTPARAGICRAGGILAQAQSDYGAARTLLEEALRLFREQGDRLNEVCMLSNLGIVEYEQGRLQVARDLYAAVLAIQRELGEQWGLAAALTNLGLVLTDLHDPATAGGYHAEALALFRELGDRRSATVALNLSLIPLANPRSAD